MLVTKQKLSAIFQQFDQDGDGQISEANIRTAFSKFGIEVTDETIESIFSMHDADGDKQISMDEFKTIFAV